MKLPSPQIGPVIASLRQRMLGQPSAASGEDASSAESEAAAAAGPEESPSEDAGVMHATDKEDEITAFFRQAGYPFSPGSNPADEMLDFVNAEEKGEEEEEEQEVDGTAPSQSAPASSAGAASTASAAAPTAAAAVELSAVQVVTPSPLTSPVGSAGAGAGAFPPGSPLGSNVGLLEGFPVSAPSSTTTAKPAASVNPAPSSATATTTASSSTALTSSTEKEKKNKKKKGREAISADLVAFYRQSRFYQLAKVDPPSLPPPAIPLFADLELAGDSAAAGKGSSLSSPASSSRQLRRYPTTWCTQFRVILHRAFLYKLRSPDAVATQFVFSVILAALIGSIFWHVPLNQPGVRDRLSVIAFVLLMLCFSPFDQVVLLPMERSVMLRDSSSGMYSSSAFYWGRTAAEMPVQFFFTLLCALITYYMIGLRGGSQHILTYILIQLLTINCGAGLLTLIGAMSKDMSMGNALATTIITLASLFNGLFLSPQNIPWFYKWLYSISFPGWAVSAAVMNELQGLQFECTPAEVALGACIRTGDVFLQQLGFTTADTDVWQEIWKLCLYMAIEGILFRLLAFFALHFMYTGQPARERLRLLVGC